MREWGKERVPKIIDGYEYKNIYKAEKTGVFFGPPPNITRHRV
jgi:hypothetical protein